MAEKTHSVVQMAVGELGTNCYLFVNEETKEGFIVDPGAEAHRIEVRINNAGIKPAAIVLTHGHYDHFMAAEELKEKYQIPIILHEADEETLGSPSNNLSAPFMGARLSLKADRLVKDGELLALAGYDFKIIHTPGHTPGSMCLYQEKLGILFSGDTLFNGSLGRTDFPGGSVKDIVTSICKKLLLVLPMETIVYPGHNDATTIAIEYQYNPTAVYLNRFQ